MTPSEIHSALVGVYHKWSTWLANPNFYRDGNEVTWRGPHLRLPFDLDREAVVQGIIDRRDYSFQTIDDGSPVQLVYRFGSDGSLESASLAFFYLGGGPDSSIPWIRVDYDPNAKLSLAHAPVHMHLSTAPSIRIPLSHVPSPRQFIELVWLWFYPTRYSKEHLGADGQHADQNLRDWTHGQRPCHATSISLTASCHLRVPLLGGD